MSVIAKVTSKGQVTIPADVRASLEIEEGDHLLFESSPKDRSACIRVIKHKSPSEFRGIFSGVSYPGKSRLRKIVHEDVGRKVSSE